MIFGEVFDRDEESLHLEVRDIGYQIFVTQPVLANAVVGQPLRLRIYTHIREDLIQLFGFESKAQENMFRSLIKVNGIGPKVALGILSAVTFAQFRELLQNKDVKGLSRLPKVGKKTAEQILLKLSELDWEQKKSEPAPILENPVARKLKLALVNLGFTTGDVHDVVIGLDMEKTFEENFKLSLAQLSQI